MSDRARHLEEMRYAVAHKLSLSDARKALAAQRRRLAEAAIENLHNRPVVSCRELRERTLRQAQGERESEGQSLPRWMMAD
jgi:hypothetical protein